MLDTLDEHQPKDLLVSVLLKAHQNVASLPDYVLKAFTAVGNDWSCCQYPVVPSNAFHPFQTVTRQFMSAHLIIQGKCFLV